MRRLLVTFLGLMCWSGVRGQGLVRPGLAAVQSMQSAQRFMRGLGVEFAEIKLDSLLLDEQQRCAWYQVHPADTLVEADLDPCSRYAIAVPKAWAKADFNQDGQPDLLVNAGYGKVNCVLNRGAQPPLVVPVAAGRRSHRDCYAFEVIRVAGRPAIAHLQVHGVAAHRLAEFETTARQDTLVYHLGAFVEYNPRPATKLPRLLDYHYHDGGPGPRSIYNLRISLKTGRVRCEVVANRASASQLVVGKWRYQLRAGMLDTLRQQVAYVPIGRLNEEYAMNVYDASTYRLVFYSRHQPPKRVEDYGGDGPYCLQRLYRLLTTAHDQAVARRWQRR